MTRISVTINSELVEADVEPRTSLADFLRNSRGLTGTHLGCEHGVCGACTVSVDGSPARSCILYAIQMHSRSVITIEGFDDDATMSDLRSEFSKQHALQCGFCTPGMLITARDIITRLGNPGEARVREELAGNLCRCTGYAGIVQAVQNVGVRREDAPPAPLRVAKPVAAQSLVIEESDLAATQPTLPEELTGGDTVIEQAIVLEAACDQVWEFFQSVPDVATCLPGAGLTLYDADTWEGTIRIKMGPIRAQLKGKGTYEVGGGGENRQHGRRGSGRTFKFARARLTRFCAAAGGRQRNQVNAEIVLRAARRPCPVLALKPRKGFCTGRRPRVRPKCQRPSVWSNCAVRRRISAYGGFCGCSSPRGGADSVGTGAALL